MSTKTVQQELQALGLKLQKSARKYALPNKKTGLLDRSLRYKTSYTGNDKFYIYLQEVFYGEYLNRKTSFMDKAIEETITNSAVGDISDVIIENLMKDKFKF